MKFTRWKMALKKLNTMFSGGEVLRYAVMFKDSSENKWYVHEYYRTPQEAQRELQRLQMYRAYDIAENKGKRERSPRFPVKG